MGRSLDRPLLHDAIGAALPAAGARRRHADRSRSLGHNHRQPLLLRDSKKRGRFTCALPAGRNVYDLFHVVAKHGREVIDRVRVDAANRVRADRPARKLIKTSHWLLLRNRSSLKDGEDVRLDELLATNRALLTVYLLKDELKQLWRYRSEAWARKAWRIWRRRAMQSRLEPLKHFARKLEPYLEGIFAHCRWPLGTNLIEGINHKIRVIKRMAYGFRDDACFFLKIRAAFPGFG